MKDKELYLVVVAHPDDEILGFGGTGAHLVKQGKVVQPIILCGDVQARSRRPSENELYSDMLVANELLGFAKPVLGDFPNIKMNTVEHIKIVQFIEKQILEFSPTHIFTHHPSDLNDDHVQVARACMAAARLFQRIKVARALKALYFVEILSSTDWAFPTGSSNFSPDTFFNIEESLALKLEALGKYRNVMRQAPHPRSTEVLTGHAAYRGGQSGMLYAEAFQTAFRVGL